MPVPPQKKLAPKKFGESEKVDHASGRDRLETTNAPSYEGAKVPGKIPGTMGSKRRELEAMLAPLQFVETPLSKHSEYNSSNQ
jgi:hypothetical protein